MWLMYEMISYKIKYEKAKMNIVKEGINKMDEILQGTMCSNEWIWTDVGAARSLSLAKNCSVRTYQK